LIFKCDLSRTKSARDGSGLLYVFLVLSFACPKERTKEKGTFSINFSGRHWGKIYDAPKTAVKIWRAAPWISKFCPPILVKKIFYSLREFLIHKSGMKFYYVNYL